MLSHQSCSSLLTYEPFAQLQHNLYENQNFSEMALPKIKSEDVKDYVSLFNEKSNHDIIREILNYKRFK